MEIKKVGVLGAGTMGSGIAQVVAQAGIDVVLLDTTDELLNKALERIDKTLIKGIEKGKVTPDEREKVLKNIKPTINIDEMKDCNLIIEAVYEDLDLKIALFKRLDTLCPENTIFSSNTSTLSITHMASKVSKPDRFLGLHFFNPAPIMRLVEVVSGLQTSQKTVEEMVEFIRAIKKIPIKVRDCPGFLVNRILLPYVGEAMLAAQEGAALPTEIDESIKKAGFPMGPLALNDMVGIDVGVLTFRIMHDAYGDRFPIPILFERLANAGRLGNKVGKGIYVNGNVDEEFLNIIKSIQLETGIKGTEYSPERLILRQVNEAVYCLQEKIATAEDIDRALVLGTGFPVDENGSGGPLHWADERGLDWVLEKLNYFKDKLGSRFWPHFLLKQYVSAGFLGKKVKKGFFEY